MELKQENARKAEEERQVLIVPLWNWNDRRNRATWTARSSNRTFMELKQEARKAEEERQAF